MGVYIKGMEMPTSCRTCHMKMNCDDCEGRECVCVPLHKQIGYLDDLLTDKRRDDCPLVPVPPHGRLIDGDVAEAICFTNEDADGKDFYDGILYAADFISQQPTIIEAEEGE